MAVQLGPWLRWQRGRQKTGYDKLLVLALRWPLPMDIHLLKYPDGVGIPPHRDPVPGQRHFRANLVLRKSTGGGCFVCENPLFESERLNVFRSDLSTHSVEPIVGKARWVLSIGWLRSESTQHTENQP